MGYGHDTFGIRLIKAQNRMQMPSAKLASLLDTSPTAVSNFRMDKHRPTFQMLQNICSVLQCSADFLLGLSDNPEVRNA